MLSMFLKVWLSPLVVLFLFGAKIFSKVLARSFHHIVYPRYRMKKSEDKEDNQEKLAGILECKAIYGKYMFYKIIAYA